MHLIWIALCLLVQGGRSFMIHNTIHSLCLEDSRKNDSVLLKRCNLNSDLQQWFWEDQRFLVNKGTSRCLSSQQIDLISTISCDASKALWWHCHGYRLVSHNNSLELTTDGRHLFLSQKSKLSKWRSLGESSICQEMSRSKRASDESDVLQTEDNETEYDYTEEAGMTEEQRQYLRWYYRTEDPSPWKYAMLGLSVGALLLGCLLFGMGSMANRNRKKIGEYKAAAAAQAARAEELQSMTACKQPCDSPAKSSQPCEKPPLDDCKAGELKSGDIVLTWKDGNVSMLYPEAREDDV
ncbi:hypothetical protein MATL_G00139590 [Megalops atlanticus]|uniref:Ricin B lectin domain-containing protein n=1 Tax=Megalops atlanticus TaxID=7932 RepID=A0A9D3PYE5_MEGAT|nr:hypothetical protein MATL_G00139590 [Megalops atlanticus]